ncbi:MAG: hypothetical protein ACI9S8_003004 [Chlamydiales bacterium]|jgi:hypothetical protein
MSGEGIALPQGGGGASRLPSISSVTGLFHKTSDMKAGSSNTGIQSWGGRCIDWINSSELLNPSNDSEQSCMSKTAGKVARFFGRAICMLAVPVASVIGALKHAVCFIGHTINALGDLAAGVEDGEFDKAKDSLLSCAKDVGHVALFAFTFWGAALAYAALVEDQKAASARLLRNFEG